MSRFAIQRAFRSEEEIVLPSSVSGAAMAKAGRRCLFHETTGLVRIATMCVFAPWRHCVEFPSDFRRMERKVAEKQSRNETGGCCHVSRFNEPSAARRKLCFLPVSRVLQWRNRDEIFAYFFLAIAQRFPMFAPRGLLSDGQRRAGAEGTRGRRETGVAG